jgi:hypothetical protein
MLFHPRSTCTTCSGEEEDEKEKQEMRGLHTTNADCKPSALWSDTKKLAEGKVSTVGD